MYTTSLCTTATVTGGVIDGRVLAKGNRIDISGGHINGRLYTAEEGSISVTGGTFVNDPSIYVDSTTHTVTQNTDGIYTVTPADSSDVTTVYSEKQLIDAVAQSGNIKLGDSFKIPYVDIINDVNLDLNGKTLTATRPGLYVYEGVTLNVSNGTISGRNTVENNGGTVSIEDCTLTGEYDAFDHYRGTSSLKDCTVNGCVTTNGGTVTLYGIITFGHGTASKKYTGIRADGGSAICHFNPDGHIYVGSEGNVTDNSDGTWTVTKAE